MNKEATLLPELLALSAARAPDALALANQGQTLTYGELQLAVQELSSALLQLGLQRGDRVAIFLEKRFETVVASFAAPAAGCVFVPLNPLLKAEQVAYILRDCNVRLLVTSPPRLETLNDVLAECKELQHIVLTGQEAGFGDGLPLACHAWEKLLAEENIGSASVPHRVIDSDMAAILYTSGSTGRPKGVVVSHRNLVMGAKSVASYLENRAEDRLLAALPLSFDAGFSQLTTAFHVGAKVVLLNYLMPRDVLKALEQEQITGLTAVPPLYSQLAVQSWSPTIAENLRYLASTGGRMPGKTLQLLRNCLPKTRIYLMYGLTEAFRSTWLPPEEIDHRPDSIGKAIPDAEILVLRPDGTPCAANEPGELVHRGPLVGMGYWNDAEKTAERFKPLPEQAPGRQAGLMLPEFAVFSGDTVRRDEDGFLYFIGRQDEMIKTSGYRVSPNEVEEIVTGTGLVEECIAFGVDQDSLGQVIQIIVTPAVDNALSDKDLTQALLLSCRARMPAYMVPVGISIRPGPLPRNPNGKIDRKQLRTEWIASNASHEQ